MGGESELMLEHLDIRNFALIENLSMDFHDGFNVITGETGAGKSIILGALGLVMGEKADAGAIRNGAEELDVNAVISIPKGHEAEQILNQYGAEPEDGQIVIRRKVRRNGRSTISVQGQSITRSELVALSDSLIDMHGQSEHQSLLVADKQRKIVDNYAGNSVLTGRCSDLYARLGNLRAQEEEILKAIEEGRRQEDYLSFALQEIENAKPQPGEDDKLREKISVLGQYENIVENSTLASDKLKEARLALFDATSAMRNAAKAHSSLCETADRIESARIEVEDLVQGISAYLSSVEYSDSLLDSLQDRLNTLQKLKRKYGPELENVLEFARSAKEKLELAQNSEEHLSSCRKEIQAVLAQYREAASSLSLSRKKSASELEKKIEAVLRELGMPDAVFVIEVSSDPEAVKSFGYDSINFRISANPGEDAKPIREIASGGELSRVMLALKTVLAGADSIQTQVFDEVDAGIGGAVALSLASCISDLSKKKQVIAVTHLAGVASRANSHFAVSKRVEDGRTYSGIRLCEGEDRVHEIARMLSGDEQSLSLEHARQMLSGR